MTSERHDKGSRLVLIDERGLRVRDLLPPADGEAVDVTPTWSPDGLWIAFASSRGAADPEATSIWIVSVQGGEAVRLTERGVDLTPAWSPDGTRLAFASNREGGDDFDVWVGELRVDGGVPSLSSPRQITRGEGSELMPAWSPGGGRVAYAASSGDRSWIEEVDADGGEPRALTDGPADSWPVWFPDGEALVVSAPSKGKDRIDLDLHRVDAKTGARTVIIDDDYGDDTGARFSPDGRFLFATAKAIDVRSRRPIWSSVVFTELGGGDGRWRVLYDNVYAVRMGVDLAPLPLDAAALREAPDYKTRFRALLQNIGQKDW